MDGIWEISNFTGMHGTGLGFHGIFPIFTGLVCTGSGSRIFSRDQFGRGLERDFQNSTGSRDYPVSRGIPRAFHNGKNPEESPGIFPDVFNPCTTAKHVPHSFQVYFVPEKVGTVPKPLPSLLRMLKKKYYSAEKVGFLKTQIS